jgi:hypothetical protein
MFVLWSNASVIIAVFFGFSRHQGEISFLYSRGARELFPCRRSHIYLLSSALLKSLLRSTTTGRPPNPATLPLSLELTLKPVKNPVPFVSTPAILHALSDHAQSTESSNPPRCRVRPQHHRHRWFLPRSASTHRRTSHICRRWGFEELQSKWHQATADTNARCKIRQW